MKPNAKEMKALREFVSRDVTRPNLTTVWEYESEGGCTHVATDGHTIVVRRAGKHVAMSPHDVAKLAPKALDTDATHPPAWAVVTVAPNCEGANVAVRGIDPGYFARVATVEDAAGRRAAEDFKAPASMSQKALKMKRAALVNASCSRWSIGVNELEGWYWTIPGEEIHWEGVIMPRRI